MILDEDIFKRNIKVSQSVHDSFERHQFSFEIKRLWHMCISPSQSPLWWEIHLADDLGVIETNHFFWRASTQEKELWNSSNGCDSQSCNSVLIVFDIPFLSS